MHYEKQILPLDLKGNFVLAIHFSEFGIGGDCTRESDHAYFAHGNAGNPDLLIDVTELCCIELKGNELLAQELYEAAKYEQENQRPDQAWVLEYQAKRAVETSKLVPKTVLTTRNGHLFIGMDPELTDADAGLATYVQRLIEVNTGTLKVDYSESEVSKGRSSVFPIAVSDDGSTIITVDTSVIGKPVIVEQCLFSQEVVTKFKSFYTRSVFHHVGEHWVASDEEFLYKIPKGNNKPVSQIKIPSSILAWTAIPAYQSSLIAFSGYRGLVSIVDIDDGKVRKYYPHRGCKRDDLASSKLSDNGLWLASKLPEKKELVVTSLASGESWTVAEISDQILVEREEGDYRAESSIPAAFNFIGEKLLVSDSNKVREVNYSRPGGNQVFVSEQGKKGARVPIIANPGQPIEKLIEKARLDRIAEEIHDLYYPACLLKTKSPKKSGWGMPGEKGAFALGTSRMGGWPDLPHDSMWPEWQNRPMAFIGQISLSEIADVQTEIRLPKSGVLLFFVGCGTDTFEREPFDQDMFMLELMPDHRSDPSNAVRVIYAKPEVVLTRRRYEGEILPELFSPCAVAIKKKGLPLPHECTALYGCMSCDESELDNYNELIDQLSTDDFENQLSGYPKVLQYTPLEWGPENLSCGRDAFHIPKSEDDLRSFNKDATQWGLLLQLVSDGNPDFQWGDAGNLYIYGRRKEMEQGIFGNCYVNFEN